MMGKPGNTGLKRVFNAAGYSLQGLTAALKHEAAFRQELMLFVILSPIALYLGETALEILLLISCLFIVLIAELINSAIEAVVDRIGSEHHELAGRAKDIGSAAVFISLLLVVFTWITVIGFF